MKKKAKRQGNIERFGFTFRVCVSPNRLEQLKTTALGAIKELTL